MSDPTITLEIGYIIDNCDDWDLFCEDLGLNPYLLSEGLAEYEDSFELTINKAVEHGLLKDSL